MVILNKKESMTRQSMLENLDKTLGCIKQKLKVSKILCDIHEVLA